MSKSGKRRQRARKLARSQSLRNPSARSLRYEPLEDRRMLAVVTVTTDQDVVDFNDGLTSLREAIFATNLVEGADEIQFDFGHDGPATILLMQGELAITDSLTITGSGAELLTIDASDGADVTFATGDGFRVLHIDDGDDNRHNNVVISGLTLTGADVAPTNLWGRGGAILNRENLTVTNSTISENSSDSGGGIYHSVGSLSLTSSMISGNSGLAGRAGSGGGIVSVDGTTNIYSSTIRDNLAVAGGGGISSTRSLLNIVDSTIQGNSANSGGGIRNEAGLMNITSSTISTNLANFRGGGIQTSRSSSTNITNSTITNNLADFAGGIDIELSWLTLENTIIAANTVERFGPDFGTRFSSIVGNYSFIGAGNSAISLVDGINGNQVGSINSPLDPLLAPLADNGGPTLTHALLPSSPAINAGDLNAIAGVYGVPLFDQRGEGFDRIHSRIDIGANEVQELGDLNLLVDTLVDESDGDYSRGNLSLREAIELANANPVPDTIRFDPIFAAIAGPLPATILLTQGELVITDSVEIVGLGAELLTIDASGNDPTPDSNNGDGSRIFKIDDSDEATALDVTLSDITLTGGDLGGGPITGQGGAIFSLESLNVLDVVITGNAANHDGGGIFTKGATTVTNSTFTENRSTHFSGGGLFAIDATLAVTGSTFHSNTSRRDGGGVFALNTTTTIHESTFTGNSAERLNGGGLWVKGEVSITDSTVSGNSASKGGGIFAFQADTKIVGSTISDNSSWGNGGGIFVNAAQGSISIAHSTITANTADANSNSSGKGGGLFVRDGVVTLNHTLAVGNQDGEGSPDIAGIINSSFSLLGFGAEFLGPLVDNGGPAFTHALLPGSPAINAGDPLAGDVPQFDQRGNPFTRISDGRIDIGAYESQSLSGDFDGDADADGDDLAQWQGDYGLNGGSDSDRDGDTDGTDFLNWQRSFGVVLSEAVSTSLVVEKSSVADERREAVDWAFAVDPLLLAQADDQLSTVESELASDFVLQPVLETTWPVHRATVRSPYRSVEVTPSNEELFVKLNNDLAVLDELFAQL